MKIKLDENIPGTLAAALRRIGHDADTVPDEGLSGQPDENVWLAAQKEGRFLITQDLDFSDMRRFVPGTHCGILLVRLKVPGLTVLEQRVTGLFRTETVENWAGRLIVATDLKLRVR